MPDCCCWITDDVLWRATRRAEEHYTKDKLSTRRGAVHSIGWLSGPGWRPNGVDEGDKTKGSESHNEHNIAPTANATTGGEIRRELNEGAKAADERPHRAGQTPCARGRTVGMVLDDGRS
jgi:hypothetical protein